MEPAESEAAVIQQGIGILIAWAGLTPDEAGAVLHDVAARTRRTSLSVAELLRAGAPSGAVDFRLRQAVSAAVDECLAGALADRSWPGQAAP